MVKNAQFSGFYHENRRKINKTPIKQGLETNFFTYKSLLVHVKKFAGTYVKAKINMPYSKLSRKCFQIRRLRALRKVIMLI